MVDLSSKTRTSSAPGWDLTLQYDSMIDGTGREILAGKTENVRNIKLDILFADENAMVCAMPTDSMSMDINNPLGEGKNILLFLKEDDLEARLKSLRVSSN